MKIAIVGAGAIGGMITALLASSGADPVLIARGKTLAALRDHGITFVERDHRATTHPRVTDDPAAEGPQDLVIIALKAQQIEAALPNILPLVGPDTLVLSAINGLPWWFFQGADGPMKDRVLQSVDPNGRLASAFDPDRLVGCAVYMASEVHAPYTVQSSGARRLMTGMINGSTPPALRKAADIFEAAEINMPLVDDIRMAVLNKLIGNLWANPLSVLTGGTMQQLTGDPAVVAVGRRMMEEFMGVCDGLGISLPVKIDQRLKTGTSLGAFRTSMLQDMDRGRPIELEAILGAVIEVADLIDRPVDTLRTAYALTRGRAMVEGCYLAPSGKAAAD